MPSPESLHGMGKQEPACSAGTFADRWPRRLPGRTLVCAHCTGIRHIKTYSWAMDVTQPCSGTWFKWPYGPRMRKEDFWADRTAGPNCCFSPSQFTSVFTLLHHAAALSQSGNPHSTRLPGAPSAAPCPPTPLLLEIRLSSAFRPSEFRLRTLPPILSGTSRPVQFTDTATTPAATADAEPMVAPATLALRPSAAPAPPRAALPRARAWFGPAIRTSSPSVAASYAPPRFSGVRRAVAVDADQQGSPEPPEQV